MSWWSSVTGWVSSAVDAVSSTVESVVNTATSWVTSAADAVNNIVSSAQDYVSSAVASQTSGVVETIQEVEGEIFEEIDEELSATTGLTDEQIQAIEDYVNQFGEFAALQYYEAKDEVITYIEEGLDIIEEIVEEVTDIIPDWLDPLFEQISASLDYAVGFLADRLEDLLAIPAKILFSLITNFFFEETEE